MKNRDVSIDIARGIAIFSVVAGHIVSGIAVELIYLFHMPFFFITSGYLHRIDPQEGRYFKRKSISLLLPYFSYLLILKGFSVFELFWEMVEHPSKATFVALGKHTFQMLYGGEVLVGTVGIFWFVTTLFLTQQAFNFVGVRVKNMKLILGIAVALYGVALLDQINHETLPLPWGFPWNINVVCGAFLFYAVGSVYGDYIFSRHSKLAISLSAVVSFLAIALIISGVAVNPSMKDTYYGIFILSPLAAFSLTKLLMYGSTLLARNGLLSVALASVGEAAITIMFAHRLLQYHPPGVLLVEWPWLMALAITLMCYVLHQIILTNKFSRAFLLGSKRDLSLLVGQSRQHKA